jgi:GrpB-like predicted nucleotidyltransferase (UPF0157 family)
MIRHGGKRARERVYAVEVRRRTALVVPYDPEWPRLFEAERSVLERVLKPWLDRGIHHVGSTAVSGLAAKPIIDIVAGVRHLEAARAAFEPLRALGYRYHEHRPEAHAFSKPESAADWWEQTHHLHLTEPGSDLWRERLAFRDALRADPELAAEYQEWKLSHAASTDQPNAYTGGKRACVARVLAEKGIELKPDSERLTPAALAARRG